MWRQPAGPGVWFQLNLRAPCQHMHSGDRSSIGIHCQGMWWGILSAHTQGSAMHISGQTVPGEEYMWLVSHYEWELSSATQLTL